MDEALKKYIAEHLHPILEAKVGTIIAKHIEDGLISLVDVDLIPKQPEIAPEEEKEIAIPGVV